MNFPMKFNLVEIFLKIEKNLFDVYCLKDVDHFVKLRLIDNHYNQNY
jgi:hypothetical protein